MASIQTRKTGDGQTRYRVRWHDVDTGKHASASFDDRATPRQFAADVDRAGQRMPAE